MSKKIKTRSLTAHRGRKKRAKGKLSRDLGEGKGEAKVGAAVITRRRAREKKSHLKRELLKVPEVEEREQKVVEKAS